MNGRSGESASSAADVPQVSISVVSHSQADLVHLLLRDLSLHSKTAIEVLLTVNVPESLPFDPTRFKFPVRITDNIKVRGFGANHNAAFQRCKSKYFCVMNPDIRLEGDPFPALFACLEDSLAGIAAPMILNPEGAIEDSARRFPTPWTIVKKALRSSPGIEYAVSGSEPLYPDWVAGMFMLIPSALYAEIGGFDERYFLYYEDVDLCARLASRDRRVVLCPGAIAVHNARRQSRSSLRFLRLHFSSMLRFFLTHRAAHLQRLKRTHTGSRSA
ncbi:MAG TPA: glycosyltransferase family 2 protein [Burkholderiales bacterium]|nr:glycosyltransferase family 2 protein [Burkholderiales bacterium]